MFRGSYSCFAWNRNEFFDFVRFVFSISRENLAIRRAAWTFYFAPTKTYRNSYISAQLPDLGVINLLPASAGSLFHRKNLVNRPCGNFVISNRLEARRDFSSLSHVLSVETRAATIRQPSGIPTHVCDCRP